MAEIAELPKEKTNKQNRKRIKIITMSTPQNAPDFGEPWHKSSFNSPLGDSGDYEGVLEIYSRDNRLRIAEAWNPEDETEEAFSRIVDAVNATAGMPDPAAEIEAMRAERDELRRDVAALLNALPHSAHDTTEGIVTIQAMRAAIREAHEALSNIASVGREYYDMDMGPNGAECLAHVDDALAKLQPFMP